MTGSSKSTCHNLPVCDPADHQSVGNRCDGGLLVRGPRCGSGAEDAALSRWSSASLFSCSGWRSPGHRYQAAQVKVWPVEDSLFNKPHTTTIRLLLMLSYNEAVEFSRLIPPQ